MNGERSRSEVASTRTRPALWFSSRSVVVVLSMGRLAAEQILDAAADPRVVHVDEIDAGGAPEQHAEKVRQRAGAGRRRSSRAPVRLHPCHDSASVFAGTCVADGERQSRRTASCETA